MCLPVDPCKEVKTNRSLPEQLLHWKNEIFLWRLLILNQVKPQAPLPVVSMLSVFRHAKLRSPACVKHIKLLSRTEIGGLHVCFTLFSKQRAVFANQQFQCSFFSETHTLFVNVTVKRSTGAFVYATCDRSKISDWRSRHFCLTRALQTASQKLIEVWFHTFVFRFGLSRFCSTRALENNEEEQ